MEKILRIFSREYGSISQAAILLGSFTLLSQILALFRDRSIAHFIGPSLELDAYYAAFRIPDLIFISIASLASITVLIPFIMARMEEEKVTPAASKFLNDIFSIFLLLMTIVSALVFFLMPYFADWVAPGFSPEIKDKLILLSRVMLLSPILMGLSNLFSTVTQLFRRFFIYSLSPIVYNLGIIIGVIFLYPIFGILGLAFGVVLGACMHFLIQVYSSALCGFAPKLSLSINWKDVWPVALTSVPRTLGLSLNSLALVSIIALASFFKEGSISVFNLSFNLQSVPLNIIGISYAVAAFPTLVKSAAPEKIEEFKNYLRTAARAIIFWSIPATFLFIVLRAQIVRVILGSPTFSWDNTRLVAASVAIFSVSILAQGLVALMSRAYYAKGNTRLPLMINLFSSISIVVFAFILTKFFAMFPVFRYFIESMLKVSDISGTEVLMLPLAYSLGTLLNCVLHWFSVRRDFMDGEPFILKSFFQSLGASFFIGLVAYLSLSVFGPIFGTTTFIGLLLQGLISGILGILAGVFILHLLQNEELKELLKTLKTKFWRAKVIAPSEEGL